MKFRPIYLIITVTLLACLVYYNGTLSMIDKPMQDYWLRDSKIACDQPDPNIVIVGIDDKSQGEDKMGKWPWPRSYHAKLINLLSKYGAKVIGFDVIFGQRASDETGKMVDEELISAVKNAGNVVFPVIGHFADETDKEVKAIRIEKSFDELYKLAHNGHINVFPDDDDNYIRQALTQFNYNGKVVPGFDKVIYQLYQPNKKKQNKPYADKWGRAYIQYAGSNIAGFDEYSYCDVLDGKIPGDFFKGKIVLVGPYTIGMADQYPVPINKSKGMNGVEIHANIIQNYMYDTFKRDVPLWIDIFLIVLVALVSLINLKKFSNITYIATTVGTFVIYGFGSQFVYSKGYIVTIFYPLATFILCQMTVVAYHYINQYLERKRVTNIFGRYVDKQIVSKLIEKDKNSLKLGGERKEISVLFVDIRGFTPLSESVTPEEVVEILNEYLTLTSSSIFKYGGTLDKFIGDATMAIFNAPMDLEDHAFMAVQAALAMRTGAEALEKSLLERFGKTVKFGIGVNTGYAIVGNIGSKARMDYTAIGDTVNTAARLESNAKPGQIIISEATYELVKDRIVAENLGNYKLKGKAHEVPVYGVIEVKENEKMLETAATLNCKE